MKDAKTLNNEEHATLREARADSGGRMLRLGLRHQETCECGPQARREEKTQGRAGEGSEPQG